MHTIPPYPDSCLVSLDLRAGLHEMFRALPEGVSEFSFANLYLFRDKHQYRLTMLPDNRIAIVGKDADNTFFMLPFGLPDAAILTKLFADHKNMKCVTEQQKDLLEKLGRRAEAAAAGFALELQPYRPLFDR